MTAIVPFVSPRLITRAALMGTIYTLDAMALTFFAISAGIVAASLPFYWLAGSLDAMSRLLRFNTRG